MRRWRCLDCRSSRLPRPGNSNRRFLAGSDPARHRLSQTRPVPSVNWMRGGRPGRSPACRSQSRTRRPLAEKRSPPSPSTSPVVDARPAYPSNAYLAHLATPDARGPARCSRVPSRARTGGGAYHAALLPEEPCPTHSAILTTCNGRICRFSTCAVDSSRAGFLRRFTASPPRWRGAQATPALAERVGPSVNVRCDGCGDVFALSVRKRDAGRRDLHRVPSEGAFTRRFLPLHPRGPGRPRGLVGTFLQVADGQTCLLLGEHSELAKQ